MDAQDESAHVVQTDASGRRNGKIVAAARVLSIDYYPIIEHAVTGLTINTADKRGEVYAQARRVVNRHLQLMRLPEPIVDLEKLALDLTIAKIERRWRAREILQDEALDGIEREAALPRPLARLVSIAVALPIIAAMIFLGLRAGDQAGYRTLVNGLAEYWFADSGITSGVTSHTAGQGSAERAPIRSSPIRSTFAAAPDASATATMSMACGGLARFEHDACARDSRDGAVVETPTSDTEPPWLASFAALRDITSGRAPSATPTARSAPAKELTANVVLPYGVTEPKEAPHTSPDVALRPAMPSASLSPFIKPANAKVSTLIESGRRASLKGDLDRAMRDFTEAIRLDPNYPDSYSERGQTFFKLGEVERAISDYSAALGRDPQHGAALRARGMAYLYQGKNDQALADLSKAIEFAERNPNSLNPIELFYARRSRSSIYDSQQQYDLEIADCTFLIESYAHDPMLADALATNYGSGAANILAMIHRQRAHAFASKSNLERAVADLTEAIPLSADHGYAALIDRSKLHEGLGRRDYALADVQAALNIRPGSEEARMALNRLRGRPKSVPPGGL